MSSTTISRSSQTTSETVGRPSETSNDSRPGVDSNRPQHPSPQSRPPAQSDRAPAQTVVQQKGTMNSRAKIAIGVMVVFFIAALITCSVVLKKKGPGRHSGREGEPIFRTYTSWATALDEPQCAKISEKIYARGGTVADAAVASLLCLGVVLPESLGIGGGFLAVYFQKSTGQVFYLDAREVAPLSATTDMFTDKNVSSREGALSIATPGELAGYRTLLDFVGSNVTQKELFETAIKLAREGFTVGEHLSTAIARTRRLLYKSKTLKETYFSEKNVTKKQGEKIYNPRLADTLEKLAAADDFANEFYNGTIGKRILEEVQNQGGILTQKDFTSYQALWRAPSEVSIQNGRYQVFSGGLSGSGPVLAMMLNVVDGFKLNSFKEDVRTYHRLIESMKFAYAKRTWLGDFMYANVTPNIAINMSAMITEMQDKTFAEEIRKKISDLRTLDIKEYGGMLAEPRDHGTSHANFFAPNGDVIAITSTVNFYFGSGVEVEGILLNNEMDDFSTPGRANGFGLMPSPSNYIKARITSQIH
ncbi:gamma-glutamyltranspeptidase 1-like [Tropilaelaps mercedesae]|uniref:Gamma-glutamyltranspeptidase 1-like n=1 Tax=Tropilaelaps mercedesae TaxID=418985 RepID=A0A1V9XYS3_9ACAR|nr:gamma-glutamyltranspeptidase 1-like [Tropilaelaps mercedesae]